MIKLFGTVIIKIVGATGSFQRGHPEVFYNEVDLKNIFEAKFFTFSRILVYKFLKINKSKKNS